MKDANQLLVAEGPEGFARTWARLRAQASGPARAAARPAPLEITPALAALELRESAVSAPEPLQPAAKEENAERARPREPEQDAPALTLDEAGSYVLDLGARVWRVKGLSAFGVDRLRVNLRVDCGGRFHVDTFDLYSARSRNAFIEGSAKALRFDESEQVSIADEIGIVIAALEKERLSLRKEGKGEAKEAVMSAADREEAMEWLRGDIVSSLAHDFGAVGCVGEETAMLTGYLAMVSRKLQEPLSVLFCARSGAGKSTLQDRLCDLCPPEDLVKYTRISGQVLFYKDENALKHKLLAVDEEGGASSAAYALRSLLSSGYLSCSVTRTDPQTGRQVADDRRVNGPASNFLTTAHPEAFDFETRNRYVMVTIDESREQTKRILELQRWNETVEGLIARQGKKAILTRHHNAQRLLEPLDVVIPTGLAYPSGFLILRREHKKYLSLIKAITLLYQHQRPRKTIQVKGQTVQYIEATEQDIALARGLASAILARNLDELAPPSRSLLEAVREIVAAKKKALAAPALPATAAEEEGDTGTARKVRRYEMRGATELRGAPDMRGRADKRDERLLVSRHEIQRATGLSYWHVRTYMAQLIEYDYIALVRGHQGRRAMYELLWEDGDDEAPAELA